MRGLAFAALAAGVLAIAPLAASAAIITESFTIDISGSANQSVLSSMFAGFDPSLGTLTGATVSLTGTTLWTPGPPGPLEPPATLFMGLVSPIPASHVFSFDEPTTIDIDLNGAASGAAIGSGPQQALLNTTDSSDGTLSAATLDGVVTYTFTPAVPTVPEPSTWAMMLVGFAGLSYAALRRKRAAREVCV
jgi:PEP-CTERM motif